METLKRHPVIAYFILAYVLYWWMFPLLQVSPLLGLFGLFGPALAAIMMAAIIGGSSGVKALSSGQDCLEDGWWLLVPGRELKRCDVIWSNSQRLTFAFATYPPAERDRAIPSGSAG